MSFYFQRSSFNKFDELEKQNLLHLLPNDDKKLEVHKVSLEDVELAYKRNLNNYNLIFTLCA